MGSGLPVPAGAGWAGEIKPQHMLLPAEEQNNKQNKTNRTRSAQPLADRLRRVCVPTQQAFRQHTRKAICHSVNYFVHSLKSVPQSVPLTNLSFHDAKGVHCHLGIGRVSPWERMRGASRGLPSALRHQQRQEHRLRRTAMWHRDEAQSGRGRL